MSSVAGVYYDGGSSDRHPVLLSRTAGVLHIVGNGIDLSVPVRQVRLTPPLGNLPRTLHLPDGAVCEVAATVDLSQMLPAAAHGAEIWLHRWERSLALALTALLLIVVVVWGFLHFGVPVLAQRIAFALPQATELSMGEETLGFLDQAIFAPTELPYPRRDEVQALFTRLQEQIPDTGGYRLELRKGGELGANALALPGGIVVVTDEFIRLTQNDDEILAVLAHEFGHARQRHILRHVLQSSAVGVVVATLTGDLASITSLAATLPTALVNARYSREFEREADDAALDYLHSQQIPASRFADILTRLQQEHERRNGAEGDGGQRSFGDLFSTHPETAERVQRALGTR